MRHGAKQTICKEEGCTKYAQVGGVCRSHGAKLRTCSVEGCTNIAMRVSVSYISYVFVVLLERMMGHNVLS